MGTFDSGTIKSVCVRNKARGKKGGERTNHYTIQRLKNRKIPANLAVNINLSTSNAHLQFPTLVRELERYGKLE